MKLSFDTKGNEKQYQACQAWANKGIFEIYYGGAKGGGKSYLGVNLIFSDALTYPGTHYFIARKELSDLIKYTIPSIHEVFQTWNLTKDYYTYNGKDNTFHLYNGSRVYLLYAKYLPGDPLYERFGSMQMTRGWIEEGGEFVEDAYKNLKISIGRWKNDVYNLEPKLLTTCNPKKNYIYRTVYKPNKEKKLPENFVFIKALIHDNKQMPKAYIKNLEETLKGSARQRLLLGNWEYDDDDNFLIDSYDRILDIFTIDYLKSGKKYIICDAARFGSDRAIIGVFDELKLIDYAIFDKSKTTEISDKIKELQIKHKVPNSRTLVDSDGVGGGVVDEVGCVGFVNNARPIQGEETTNIKDTPNYDNIKSQCGFELARVINDGGLAIEKALIPDHEKEIIIEELEQLRRQDDDKQLKLISKSDMKDNIARSPDWLDLFIMRMYFVIKTPELMMFNKSEINRGVLDENKYDNSLVVIKPPTKADKYYSAVIGKHFEDKIYIDEVVYSKNNIDILEIETHKIINNNSPSVVIIDTSKDTGIKIRLRNKNESVRIKAVHDSLNVALNIRNKSSFIKKYMIFRSDYPINSDYDKFMKDVFSLLQDGSNKDHDDAPDNLATYAKQAQKMFPDLYNT